MSRNQARKPKGTPVGGQFDRTLGGGPATTLGDDTAESNLEIQSPQMTDEDYRELSKIIDETLAPERAARTAKTAQLREKLATGKPEWAIGWKEYRDSGRTPNQDSVKDWYIKNFDSDDLGPEVSDVTFGDLAKKLMKGEDVYPDLAHDSVVRERVFQEIDRRGGQPGYAYKLWMDEYSDPVDNADFEATVNNYPSEAIKPPKPDATAMRVAAFDNQVASLDAAFRGNSPGWDRVRLPDRTTLDRTQWSDHITYDIVPPGGDILVKYDVPRERHAEGRDATLTVWEPDKASDVKIINSHLDKVTNGEVSVTRRRGRQIFKTKYGESEFVVKFVLNLDGTITYGVPSTEGYWKGTLQVVKW